MCWLWPTWDGHGVYVMDLSYLWYICDLWCLWMYMCDLWYISVCFDGKVTKQAKKIDHRGRALHTSKSLFAVCSSLRHTTKMVARATWELPLPCAWLGSTRRRLPFCREPGLSAHGEESHLAVRLVSQHTSKNLILPWAWSGSTRQSWPLLRTRPLRYFCVPRAKKTHGIRFYRVPCGRRTTKMVFTVSYCAVHSLPCAAHGKCFAVCFGHFAVCLRHTANLQSPVVAATARGTRWT